MILNIQNPAQQDSISLQETIIAATENAIRGGGVFAFVTLGGINLSIEDNAFRDFLTNGTFELIIGIDEITNLRSVEKLNELNTEIPNINVRAFLHAFRGSTFHPKFCWFKKNNGGVLVIGSGNLTIKGLRDNWEAFSVVELTEDGINEVESYWNDWITSSIEFLKPLENTDVRARAEQNILIRRRRPVTTEEVVVEAQTEEEIEEEHPEDINPWQLNDNNIVLIAEIPRGGDRWNQANFNQESFENFFGGTRWNNNYRILLREVTNTGDLNPTENRQAVSVQSHNWRFELGAAAGLDYPIDGRPIGVFVRTGIRMFLYTLIMPGSPNYNEVDHYLNTIWDGRNGRMRRVEISLPDLEENCPNLPFWDLD